MPQVTSWKEIKSLTLAELPQAYARLAKLRLSGKRRTGQGRQRCNSAQERGSHRESCALCQCKGEGKK